mmetsp:Transcript_64311/g.112147  ORF Transcript_64311/g.112147 Transcript_64311/m.112147 type:complete len:320 (+) Transcript_64311:84-1043(+)
MQPTRVSHTICPVQMVDGLQLSDGITDELPSSSEFVPSPQQPGRRATPVALDADVVQPGGPWVAQCMATPKNTERPNLAFSVQTMTASFRGSAINATHAHVGHLSSPTCQVAAAPLVLDSTSRPPTAGQQWCTTPGGSQRARPSTPLVEVDSSAVHQSMPTPKNSDRSGVNGSMRMMMPRSSRSIRGTVLVSRGSAAASAEAGADDSVSPRRPNTSPAGNAHLAQRAGYPVAPLGQEVAMVSRSLDSGPLSTPKNRDRRDMNCSMELGIPSFRGSAMNVGTPVAGRLLMPPVLPGTPAGTRRTPAGQTSAAAGRCFGRA